MDPSKNNTQTEEDDTIALKKKRARRVSFADNEITSVHVFRRDDDSSSSDAPPDPSILGFFRDLATDSDDDERPQPDDDADPDHGNSFLRPVGFPSPGGSSTADDGDIDEDDDFHGPVSACFIRPDRLSDSGASDDVTMDSTAFSLHYRSLARSDSGDIKTRQFGPTTPSPQGSFMDLSEGKRPSEVVAVDVKSGGRDSNDMSIEGELERSYEYGRLSPVLDAIFAEGGKYSLNVPEVQFSLEGLPASSVNQVLQIQASDSSIKENKEFDEDAAVPLCRQLDFANANRRTSLKGDEDIRQLSDSIHQSGQENQNPIHGFTPMSFSGRKQLLTSSPDSSRYNGNITPSLKNSGSFGPEVYITHGATPSSVHKSILKWKTPETTPIMSNLKEGIDRLKSRLSKYSPGTSFSNRKDHEFKPVESCKTPLEEKLFSLTPENNMHQGLIDRDDHGIQSSRNTSKSSQNKENMESKRDYENFNLISAYISYNDENPKSVKMAASPSQITHLTRLVDVNLADTVADKRKDEILIDTHDKPFSSLKLFDQNLSPSVKCQSNSHDALKQVDKQLESVNSGLGQAIECYSQPVAYKLELCSPGNSKQPESPFDVAQSASKKKSAESPSRRIQVPSTPIQEVTTQVQDLSPKGNSDGHGLDNSYHPVLQVGDQKSLTKSDIEISSGTKRKSVEILSDGDNINKIGRNGKSPEVHKNENGNLQLVLKQTAYMRSEREKLGDQTLHDWDLILKKFLDSTNQFLSPSVDKLNLRLIDRLEDILVQLQKVKKADILCSEIHCQHKITDPLNIPRDQRVAETRMLLYNIAYEKAKLQLKRMKCDRLLKKVQQLNSGLRESEVIRLNFLPSSSKSGAMDTQANDSHIHSTLTSHQGKYQVSCKKVMEMRQELETLNSEAKSLSEFLYRCCKMEGDQSYANTMKVVSCYLQKRMACKSIFQNLKSWDIEDFDRKDGCYRVVLNYCGYMTQRFTVNTGLPSILISNNLNDVNISKTFPNLDASSAFMFVLNPHTTKKCTGSISLARETQITSSLLSTLLDVVEEVQLARIEIRNLVEAKFYSHSVQRLDLQLSFIDFCSGRKVKVTFDMTCLKCGTYPVEVLPSQICDTSSGEQKSQPLSLVGEIRTAAESVRIGYSRIIRLCRCISQAVQACTQSQ